MLLSGLILGACTGGRTGAPLASPPPTGAEAMALAPYAERYASIVAPVESAVETFASNAGALSAGASVDEFVVIARPLADTMAKVDSGLRHVTWPATVLGHVTAQLAADKSLRSYLLGTLDVTLLIPTWRHQVISAANRVRAARRLVSIDLGLPPPGG